MKALSKASREKDGRSRSFGLRESEGSGSKRKSYLTLGGRVSSGRRSNCFMVSSIFVKDKKISQKRGYPIRRVRKTSFCNERDLSIKTIKASRNASFLTSSF